MRIDQNILQNLNIQIVVGAAVLLFVLVLIAISVGKNGNNKAKKIIFWSIVFVIILSTFFFTGTTLYINLTSITKGPVHWHADFKILVCGQEIEPVDIKGLSNKLGTNLLHEHEDRRIHVEGVVAREDDVTLSKFFEAQGGRLTSSVFSIPTNEGLRTITSGERCGNGEPGVWQVFLYTTNDNIASQQKLNYFADHVPSPFTSVPPGDCIIFEFGPEKEKTDVLCNFYKLEADEGNLRIQ